MEESGNSMELFDQRNSKLSRKKIPKLSFSALCLASRTHNETTVLHKP